MFDDFIFRALIAGIGLAIIAGPTGCFIVWRRLAYFGETIAHSSLLGVALAMIFELPVDLEMRVVVGIFFTASLIVFVMFFLERREGLASDTILGILAHGGLAIGLVILSFFPDMRLDLHSLLFGDILAVTTSDILVIWIGGIVILGILAYIWRALITSTVSQDLAAVAGMKPDRIHITFGILLALVIAVAVKIVGVLLIVAMLVIPAATARRLSRNPEMMAIVAVIIGILAVCGGLMSSVQLDTPSGPSIVVATLLLFVVSRFFPNMLPAKSK